MDVAAEHSTNLTEKTLVGHKNNAAKAHYISISSEKFTMRRFKLDG